MKVHFIAIGGSIMHNLAISLRKKGYKVTGSDDEIFEPAASRLDKYGLLPPEKGWFPEKITPDTDAVILGMHAREDNPELKKARELGLKIYSFPAYVFEQVKDKQRVVIGGSHGKTTITSMIMHVLKFWKFDFDYLVGSQLEGFDLMVKLTEEAPVVIIEGDEYLSSAIEKVPKFHLYKPHIALVSGIAWDHVNVFPTFVNYVAQFEVFVGTIEDNGVFIFNQEDDILREIALQSSPTVEKVPYDTPDYTVEGHTTYIIHNENKIPLRIFGKHNLQNMEGARLVCNRLGVEDEQFYEAMKSFQGAARRMELVAESSETAVYKDFAHSPSKLKATIGAVKEQYPDRRLVACMELHTFSSLNKTFLEEYRNTMDDADEGIVYFNSHTLELKKLPPISKEDIHEAFANEKLKVFNQSSELLNYLSDQSWNAANLLMMSSGNFDNVDLKKLAGYILDDDSKEA